MLQLPEGFVFAVDPASRNPQPPPQEEDASLELQRTPPKILIVDDERLVADTLAEILESAGYHVAVAYDGWAALDAAKRFQPDYLLSDVLMPNLNGVELAIAIQKLHPATRIFLFSGQAGISDILLEGQKRGYEFELIAKPIHPLKLIEHFQRE